MFGGGKITADLWHLPSTLVSPAQTQYSDWLVGDPETEQWGPCEVSDDFMHSPGPHPNHNHLLRMTNSYPGWLFCFRYHYNIWCFTTKKQKNKTTKRQNVGTHLFYGSIHRDARRNKCTIPRSEPTLTLSTSVRLSGTWQLPVSGSKRACVDLVRIHILASRLLCALEPARARPNAVPNSLNLHYSDRLENVPSLLRGDKKMSRMPQNASEMRKKPQAERWTDKESGKTWIDN